MVRSVSRWDGCYLHGPGVSRCDRKELAHRNNTSIKPNGVELLQVRIDRSIGRAGAPHMFVALSSSPRDGNSPLNEDITRRNERKYRSSIAMAHFKSPTWPRHPIQRVYGNAGGQRHLALPLTWASMLEDIDSDISEARSFVPTFEASFRLPVPLVV